MMKYRNQIGNGFFNVLLFSGLGCFSLFFLVRYTDIPLNSQDILMTPKVYLAVSIIFTGVGLSLLYLSRKIRNAHPSLFRNRKKLILSSVITAVILFASNYLLLVTVKWIVGTAHPFGLQWHGVRMLVITWMIELLVSGLLMINNFYRQIILLYERNANLEESSLKAQYQALQSQLNPHFLFNSLNALIAEIEYSPEKAIEFTRYLSDVYRYILQSQERQMVPLREELEFLHSFIFLHKVRLGECITVENRIKPSLLDSCIPPLTLQLLVENIIKHNIISLSKPMNILLDTEDSPLRLVVKNQIRSKQGIVPSGKGLVNLAKRYRLLCNQEIQITKDSTCFIVKVPLLDE